MFAFFKKKVFFWFDILFLETVVFVQVFDDFLNLERFVVVSFLEVLDSMC